MKKILVFLMALLPLSASADAVEIDGIWYNLISKSKTAEVTYDPSAGWWIGNCYSGSIAIPSKITYDEIEYSVTKIGDWTFYKCSNLLNVDIPDEIVSIGNSAFRDCNKITSLSLPNALQQIGENAFTDCPGITTIVIPENVERILGSAFAGCNNLQYVYLSSNITEIESCAFYMCHSLKAIAIPNGVTVIKDDAFGYCDELTTITIPNSVELLWHHAFEHCPNLKTIVLDGTNMEHIYSDAFANCDELTDVYCFAEDVPTTDDDAFENSYVNYATLHVPTSAISAYSASAPWSGFGTITAITSEDITIGDLGIGTFCGSNPIDFTGIEDIKAYVVSSYDSGTGQVTLTRVNYVPPFTGVIVKGDKGVHTIPAGVGQPVYPNLLKGVTTNTALNKVNGDYTNYVLANKGGNLGFYAVSDGSTLGAGKAYLPLPTADLPSAAREFVLVFDDGETTEIKSIASQEEAPKGCYDLQGRRVANPTAGLYIVNGKKVIIK